MERKLLTVTETAEALRLKPQTLRVWVMNRRVPYVKLGSRVLFELEEVEKLVNESRVAAAV